MQEGCEPPGRKEWHFKEKSEKLNIDITEKSEKLNYFNLEMPAGSIKLQQK